MEIIEILNNPFYVFLLLSRVWGIFQSKTEIIEVLNKNIEYSKQEIQLKDATILGKFWNDKGQSIVVYDEDTKVLEVDFSEW